MHLDKNNQISEKHLFWSCQPTPRAHMGKTQPGARFQSTDHLNQVAYSSKKNSTDYRKYSFLFHLISTEGTVYILIGQLASSWLLFTQVRCQVTIAVVKMETWRFIRQFFFFKKERLTLLNTVFVTRTEHLNIHFLNTAWLRQLACCA